MDQLVQIGRYSSHHGIHHHVHLLLHHLHILGYMHRTDFYFRGAASVFWTVSSARNVALFLVFPFFPGPPWVGDYNFVHRNSSRRVGFPGVARSSSLVVIPTLSCVR